MTTAEIQFEQPDLRSSNEKNLRGSTYQHPHTSAIVPSVTTISGMIDKSGFLIPWSAKLAAQWAMDAENFKPLQALKDEDARVAAVVAGAKKLREAGRDVGSSAHNAIEALSLGKLAMEDVPERIQHHVNGWLEWCGKFVSQFVLIEATVWSHQHQYAGTLDLVAILKDGRHCLIDYKTGKEVYTDVALQLAAIRNADVVLTTDGEFAMPRIDCCAVLHLPDEVRTPTGKVSVRGKWSFREVTADQNDFDVFLALRKVYDWEHEKTPHVLGGKQTSLKIA